MKDKISAFKSYLEKSTELSQSTINFYLIDVRQFADYLSANGFDSFSDITNALLLAYCAKLQSRGMSKASILRKLSSVKKFYSFLNVKFNAGVDITSFIDLPKHKKSLPKFISVDDVDRLFDALDLETLKGRRDRAMLELLYATGIKVTELVELKLLDVSIERMELTCPQREGFNTLPFPKQTKKALKDYMENVRPVLVKDKPIDLLFVNMKGSGMTRQGFWKIVKELSEKAGIEEEISPNTLRNSFAVHLINNGTAVMDIKDMMGHSDISTTQAYYEAAKKENLRRSVTKNHPRSG